MKERSRQKAAFDAEEVAALAALGCAPPSAPSACPDPSLLLAVNAEVLDDVTIERVRAHLAGCVTCRTLAGDLAVILDADPDERERARIRERVLVSSRRKRPGWQAFGAAALATAATIAFFIVRAGVPVTPAAPPAPAARISVRADVPPVFAADRPAIERPEPELTLRGEPAALLVSEQIGRGLDAADDGRLGEAERLLRALVVANPDSADAHLALGAVLLRADRAPEAVATLERARALAGSGSESSDEFDWFLAVALARSGNTARASAALAALCSRPSSRAALACAGLAELERPSRR